MSKELELREIYHLMISGISPRPIAFVGSKSRAGVDNLAPFSYFNGFGSNPPIIGFSPANSGRTGEKKDTLLNIEETKEFTVSIVNSSMVEQMSLTSCDYDSAIYEFTKGGFKKKNSLTVDCYSVDSSPFIMECKLRNIIDLGGKPGSGNLILGEVLCFHVSNDVLDDKNNITLLSVSSVEKDIKTMNKKNKNELSKIVAEKLAKKAQEKKITKIYFDRGKYKYHGRVKTFADTLRKNGMEL